MVMLAEVLADLTSLKTISLPDALTLVSGDRSVRTLVPGDNDLVRSTDFLELQSEQKKHQDLLVKRKEVDLVAERLALKLN